MTRDTAAKRYAIAAFIIARDEGKLERWAAALDGMASLWQQPDVAAFLIDNKVPLAEKWRLLGVALTGDEPLALNLAKLLVAKGRFRLIEQVREEFQRLWDEERGIVHVQAITAVPLSREEREAMAGGLASATGRQVVLEEAVDPAILGGAVLRIGDRLIDGSPRTRLQTLRHLLTNARH